MTFNWNIIEWVHQMIPYIYRKNPLIDYVKVLVSPIAYIYGVFMDTRLTLLKKMRFNGQVIVLENMLNDIFDTSLRRIRILTISDTLRKKYVYQKQELKPLWVYQRSENLPVYIHLLEEYRNNGGYDFIVEVPDGVYSAVELEQIKIYTNYYKLAGKRAKYIFQNGLEF